MRVQGQFLRFLCKNGNELFINRHRNIFRHNVIFVLRVRNNYLFYSYLFSFNWLIGITYYNLLDVFSKSLCLKKNWAIFERILFAHEYSEILESLHNQISLRYLFLMQVFQESGYIPYWRHSSFPIDEHLLLWGVYLIYIILFHTFVCFGSLIMAKRGTL